MLVRRIAALRTDSRLRLRLPLSFLSALLDPAGRTGGGVRRLEKDIAGVAQGAGDFGP